MNFFPHMTHSLVSKKHTSLQLSTWNFWEEVSSSHPPHQFFFLQKAVSTSLPMLVVPLPSGLLIIM
jgi:hypothetical protein